MNITFDIYRHIMPGMQKEALGRGLGSVATALHQAEGHFQNVMVHSLPFDGPVCLIRNLSRSPFLRLSNDRQSQLAQRMGAAENGKDKANFRAPCAR